MPGIARNKRAARADAWFIRRIREARTLDGRIRASVSYLRAAAAGVSPEEAQQEFDKIIEEIVRASRTLWGRRFS